MSRLPRPLVLATLIVGLPLIVAAIALARIRWYPVLDLAMTELRVRDVGTRQTPLIGLPGRIGEFPEQGSHPGPLSFYLLTPPYRVLGSSAWALQVASALVNLVAVSTALWIGRRRGGRAGVVIVAAVLAVAVRGYGIELLMQPWNPYLPLVAWLVVLLATWSVLCGDHLMLVPLVVAASFCAQTHVPYLVLCVTMVVLAAVWMVVDSRRDGAVDAAERRATLRSVALAAGVGAVLWLPAFVDQLRREPGNISMLLEHFTGPSDDPIGLRAGFELTLRHLDVVGGFAAMLGGSGTFVTEGFRPDGRIWPGVIVLLAWAASVAVAWILRHGRLLRLHAVIAVALVVGLFSMSRIFGKIWYYLTLWAWGTSVLLLAAVVWTAVVWWQRRSRPAPTATPRRVLAAAAGLTIVASAATAVSATTAEPPEPHLSETLGDVLAPTLEAIAAGVGPATGEAGVYRVSWDDAYFFGSQGYGMVSELERAGLRAGVDPPWRVPVTAHRVLRADEVTAGVHLATGFHVERWRDRDDATEVAFVEPRDADELAEYAELRRTAIDELIADDLTELVDLVDSNLFLVSNDERVSAAAAQAMARMLILGQETAVFLITPEAPR